MGFIVRGSRRLTRKLRLLQEPGSGFAGAFSGVPCPGWSRWLADWWQSGPTIPEPVKAGSGSQLPYSDF